MVNTLPLEIVADELARLRAANPLVHLLTNEVVQEITANVLLAAGAAPAMIVAEEEAAAFTAISGALLVNVGTLYPARLTVMQQAVAAANQAGVPWTLDPVAVGVLDYRTRACGEFIACRPAAIRGNASEIMALAVSAMTRTLRSCGSLRIVLKASMPSIPGRAMSIKIRFGLCCFAMAIPSWPSTASSTV